MSPQTVRPTNTTLNATGGASKSGEKGPAPGLVDELFSE